MSILLSLRDNARREEKSYHIFIDKEITGVADGSVTTDKESALAQIGKVVNFEVRIPIAKNAINYVFEDDMSDGLTSTNDVAVYLVDNETAALPDSPTAITAGTNGEGESSKYGTVAYENIGNLEIKITFDNKWLAANNEKTIVIRYTATVNKDAYVASQDNPNTATIKWGNTATPLTDTDTVHVYSAKITVKKVDAAGEPLNGAKFVLGKTSTGPYYKHEAGTIVTWVDDIDEATVIEPVQVNNTGDATAEFTGLANGSYVIIETEAPANYNKAADTPITIGAIAGSESNEVVTLTTSIALESTVENNQGTELPATGGIGTTIFYIVGAVLVLGAAAVILARRKAEAE